MITLIALLVALALPNLGMRMPAKGHMVQTLSNAKQIYLASFQMAADHAVSENPLLGWPGDLAAAKVDPVKSLPELVERMAQQDYIKRGDLGKVFAAPGIPIYNGSGSFQSRNSALKIYKVTENDVAQCVFAATKNFTFGKGLDDMKVPYKDKGCVIFRKGGDGLALGKMQSKNTALVGFMPGATTQAAPGKEEGSVWE